MDHVPNLTRDATWPPNHEIQFDFTLESVCNFLQPVYFRPICPVSSRPHQNCRSWRKCRINPRAKLKHFLCLGDFRASLPGEVQDMIQFLKRNLVDTDRKEQKFPWIDISLGIVKSQNFSDICLIVSSYSTVQKKYNNF